MQGKFGLFHPADDTVGAEIEPLGSYFRHFWGQDQKMLKLRLLGLISCTSEAKEGKWSHGALEAKGVGQSAFKPKCPGKW